MKIGVTVSATGPAASLGIPEKNTIALLPKEIAGQKVEYIVLDDATDSTQAVKNARKLTSEDHVDALIGSTVVPNSLAMIDIAAETHHADDLDGRRRERSSNRWMRSARGSSRRRRTTS